MKRQLRWEHDEPKIPKRPYRDSAIVYAALAGVIVAIALLTGGSIPKAVLIAVFFFFVATAWSWSRWRRRVREEARRQAARERVKAS